MTLGQEINACAVMIGSAKRAILRGADELLDIISDHAR